MVDVAARTAIVAAAVTAAGPIGGDEAAWADRVSDLVGRVAAMCADRSPTARLIDSIETAKVFAGTLISGYREDSSTRDVVRLATRPSTHHPDGIEEARTERGDTAAGARMSNRLRTLVGHRLLLWVELDEMAGGAQKVRVIRHVEDLGVAPVAAPTPIGRGRQAG